MSDRKPDPADLDLIRMVQQARMRHDSGTEPSRVNAVYWIEAKRAGSGPAPTARAGYWEVEATVENVDALWAAVKAATEAGQLGYKSKVATAARGGQRDERLIYVITYDGDDMADVERVRVALERLGISPRRYLRQRD